MQIRKIMFTFTIHKNEKNMKTLDLDLFVKDYLTTASWVDDPKEENTPFTKASYTIAKADCIKFITAVTIAFGYDRANEILTTPASDLGYLAPHCFYLNRNGHGTGFWDREEFGDDQNALSDIAKTFGETYTYVTRGKLAFG